MHYPRQQWRFHVLLVVALGFLLLPFLSFLADADYVLVFRDLLTGFLPSKTLWLKTLLHEGHLPQWNPYIFAGTPYWADLKSGILNPMNVIFLFFGEGNIPQALGWFIFAHFPLMTWGMFRLLRRLGLEQEPSLLFAVVYALSGVNVSTTNMLNLLGAITILPFFLSLVLEAEKQPARLVSGTNLALMLCLALPIYVGSPEFSYFFGLYLLLRFVWRPSLPRALSLAVVGGGAILLAAAQLLPGWDNLLETNRELSRASAVSATAYSFHPVRLAEFFFQLPFGNYVPVSDYWGTHFQSSWTGYPLFFSVYLGVSLSLGLTAFFAHYRKQYIFPTLLALLCLFLAFGDHLRWGLFGFFFEYFPLWKVFRSPEKLLVPLSLLLVLAQAIGWQQLLAREKTFRAKLFLLLGALFLALLVFLVLGKITATPQDQFAPSLFLYFLAIFFVQALVLFLLHKRAQLWPYRWWLLLLVFGTDLSLHARAITWEVPLALLQSPVAVKIQKNLAERQAELENGASFRYTSLLLHPATTIANQPADIPINAVGQSAYSSLYRLLPSTGILFGVSDIYGMGALQNARKMQFWRELSETQPRRTLNLLGAYYLGQFTDSSRLSVKVGLNKDALPYLFTPAEIEEVAEVAQVKERLLEENFQEARQALLETGANRKGLKNRQAVELRILEKGTDSLLAKVQYGNTLGQTSFFLWNESFNKHWKAYVNGQSARVIRANGWSIAVDVGEAREAEVLFRYENPWIAFGTLTTLLFFLLYAAACIWRGRA